MKIVWIVLGSIAALLVFAFIMNNKANAGNLALNPNYPLGAPPPPPPAAPKANSQSPKGFVGTIKKADEAAIAWYTASAKIASKFI